MECVQVSYQYLHHTLIQNSYCYDLTDYTKVLFLVI